MCVRACVCECVRVCVCECDYLRACVGGAGRVDLLPEAAALLSGSMSGGPHLMALLHEHAGEVQANESSTPCMYMVAHV